MDNFNCILSFFLIVNSYFFWLVIWDIARPNLLKPTNTDNYHPKRILKVRKQTDFIILV